jgi:hypothetical protein
MIASCYRKSKHACLWMGRYARQVAEDIGVIDERHASPRVLTSVAVSRTDAHPQAASAIDMGRGGAAVVRRLRSRPPNRRAAYARLRTAGYAWMALVWATTEPKSGLNRS